jgi:hypothetical protein
MYMVHIREYVLQGITELQLHTWGRNAKEMYDNGQDLADYASGIVVSTEFGLFL